MFAGHETYVAITATHTTTRHDLKQLSVAKRKCYFTDEFHLQLFNSYSVKNCWMESLTNFSKSVNPGINISSVCKNLVKYFVYKCQVKL